MGSNVESRPGPARPAGRTRAFTLKGELIGANPKRDFLHLPALSTSKTPDENSQHYNYSHANDASREQARAHARAHALLIFLLSGALAEEDFDMQDGGGKAERRLTC